MSIENRAYDRNSYILVVDDDDTLLKFFKIHLNKFFSKVLVVRSAKEAIATLKEKSIDLVLSDIRMSRMDGIQLMKKVRSHDPSIPVYLVSGAMLTDEQKDTVDNKADGFLRKPFSIDELHAFIDHGMKHREIFRELYAIVQDPKKFQEMVRGQAKFKSIKDEKDRLRAEELITQLKAS